MKYTREELWAEFIAFILLVFLTGVVTGFLLFKYYNI